MWCLEALQAPHHGTSSCQTVKREEEAARLSLDVHFEVLQEYACLGVGKEGGSKKGKLPMASW